MKSWQKNWMKSLLFKKFAFTELQLNFSKPLSLKNLLLFVESSPKKLQVNLCYPQQFVWEISRRHGNQFWCRSDIIEKQFLWLVTYLQVLLLPGVIFTKKKLISNREIDNRKVNLFCKVEWKVPLGSKCMNSGHPMSSVCDYHFGYS